MNLQPYNLNYQDGLNSYPIIDYIDAKIAESGGNIIIDGQPLTNLIYSSNSNTYINNPHIDGEIRFANVITKSDNDDDKDYKVKIDKNGKLQLYHYYTLTQPTLLSGWFDVEDSIGSIRTDVLANTIEGGLNTTRITILEGDVAINSTAISENTAQITAIETFVYDKIAQDEYEQLKEGLYDNIKQSAEELKARLYQSYQNWAFGFVITGAATYTLGEVLKYNESIKDFNDMIDLYSNTPNSNISTTQRRELIDIFSNAQRSNIKGYYSNVSNLTLEQGFINSNIITDQFIPTLKSNKIMLGNITTPNSAYQVEMTGDLNLNMLYLNSTSLTSLLNQKQGNLTFTQPLYNTTNTIGLNYDSSLTKVGNNLSVVKTATTPIVITGNDFSLNYDSSLTKVGNNLSVVKTATTPIVITGNDFSLNYDSSLTKITGNLSVVKTASLPLVITDNNWTLNYDSTLTLSGNNLSVASATASKWTTSGTNIYNNNTGNVGIGTNSPSYKLHIEDGSVFIGDSSVGNGSQTDNGYRLVFDSSYTATGANKCNKILLHKNDNAPTYVAGFGIEAQGLTYSAWTGGYHNFYTSATTTSGGFLSCSIYRDNFRFYGSTNAGAGGVISNGNNGTSAYSYVSLANDTGNGILFLNSSTKTTDGGANCLTLRNDVTGGDLRLSANLDTPYIYLKKSTGLIGIDTTAPAYKLTVNGSLGCGAINSTSITTNNNAINAGTGGLTCGAISSGTITTNNNSINAGTATVTASTFSGKINPTVNVWNTSSDGYNRFYFANTSRTYFSSGSGFEWRHSTDAGIAVMSTIGQLGLDNLSPIGLLSLGDSSKVGSDGSLVIHKNSGGGSQRHMKMGFYTSTYDLTIGDFGNNNLPGSWVKTFYITWNAPNTSLAVLSNGIVYTYYGFQSASDIKLKTNIKTIDNALWKVEQLRGVEYHHIITQDKNIGLIAQEVEFIVPEVIGYNEETDTKTINYNGLVGLLVEAIKDLKAEINNLNNRIELLENK